MIYDGLWLWLLTNGRWQISALTKLALLKRERRRVGWSGGALKVVRFEGGGGAGALGGVEGEKGGEECAGGGVGVGGEDARRGGGGLELDEAREGRSFRPG